VGTGFLVLLVRTYGADTLGTEVHLGGVILLGVNLQSYTVGGDGIALTGLSRESPVFLWQ